MLTASNMVDFTLILAAHQILSKTARIGAEAEYFQWKALLASSIEIMKGMINRGPRPAALIVSAAVRLENGPRVDGFCLDFDSISLLSL